MNPSVQTRAQLTKEIGLTEEALRESEERYRQLYENAPIWDFSVDMSGRITDVNKGATELLGYARHDLIGRSVIDLYADTPAGKKKARHLNQRIRAGEEIYGEELQMRRADDSLAWVSLTVQLTSDAEGRPVGRRGLVLDITERKEAEEEARLRSEELEALFNVARLLAEAGTFEDKARRVLEEVVTVSQVDSAHLRVPDDTEEGLRLVASAGLRPVAPDTIRPYKDSRGGEAFQREEPIIANDYGVRRKGRSRSPGPRRGGGPRTVYGAQSAAWFPVKAGGRIYGVIAVNTRKVNHFTPERVRLLETIAGEIGTLLENASLREADRSRVQELEVLHGAAQILSGGGSFEARVRNLLDEIVKVAGDWATLRLPDDNGEQMHLAASTREGSLVVRPRDDSPSGKTLDQKRPVVVNDYVNHPTARDAAIDAGIRSKAYFPVMVGGESLGVIAVSSRDTNYFTPARVALLATIAAGIGPSLEHARLEEEARERDRERAQALEELEALVTVTGLLVESGDFEERVTRVLEELGRVLEADDIVLRQWDEAKGGLVRVASADPARWTNYPVPVRPSGEGLSGQAFRSGDAQVSNEYATDTRATPAMVAEGVKAVASLPVRVEGHTLGTITLVSRTAGFFTPDRMRLVSAVVDGTGVLMERARLQEEGRERERQRLQALEQLQVAQQQLIQSGKLAAIGELVSGVAHEINNPLAGISGHTQLLLRRDRDAAVKESLELIYAESQRVTRIVQNLLSFAREQPPQDLPLSINETVTRTLELRSYDLGVNNIELVTDLDPGNPAVFGDLQQLQQVFLNIVNNAQQAMVAAQGRGRLEVKTRRAKGNVRVTFTDDGPGIPADVIDRVFDPFFTTKEVGKGTGLGLSICYGIVAEHGGSIWAESPHGEGSIFTVELPLAEVAPVPSEEGPSE